jgi:peptide/nickel transport system substrate-binding protein
MSESGQPRSWTDETKRRKFLALVGGAGSAMLAGCGGGGGGGGTEGGGGGGTEGGSDGSTVDDGTETAGDRSGDKYGGTIRTFSPAPVASLNPMMNTSGAGYVATAWLYSKLTRTDTDLNVYGDLAEEWEANEDASEWTFTLRPDATFNHNGEPVTAEDVKATLEKRQDPDTGSPGAEALPTLDSVEAVDEHTVRVVLTGPDADVPAKLSGRWSGIMPKEVVESDDEFEAAANEGFGCGAWVVDSFSRESELVVSAADDWHLASDSDEEYPFADSATQRVISGNTSVLNAIRQEEIDLAGKDISPTIFSELSNISGVETYEVPSGRSYPILMDTTEDSEFSDRALRHAIKYAVNKEAILEVAGGGLGVVGQDNFVSPVHRYFTELPEEFGPGAQPDMARQKLEEAGHPDGIDLDTALVTSPEMSSAMADTAVIAQENCAEVGINFDIEQVSSDFWLSSIEGQGEFYVGIYGLRIIEDKILRQVHHSDGPWNYGWSNEEFDNAIDEARATSDPERRQELYAEAQEIAQMNAGMITPFFQASLGMAQDYVSNYEQDPTSRQLPLYDKHLSSDAPTK